MSDLSEKSLETLIVRSLIEEAGYVAGSNADYDRGHAVDLAKLFAFVEATQPEAFAMLGLAEDGPKRQAFLARLQGEITKRGVVDVLRKGISHGPVTLTTYYPIASAENAVALAQHAQNIFSVTRQFHFSVEESKLSLDLCLFLNGLPIATFELKNRITKQSVLDAVEQYQRDRDPRELLFQFGRCVVHFAVDDQEVRFCPELKGKASWFLPFNKGYRDGAGNPPNPEGLKTDYLWREILTKPRLTDILENYAQITQRKDRKTGKLIRRQVFPRYHQLEVVRKLLGDARVHRAGRRYLIQHSAGSGKSNSIAWLAHQLAGLQGDGGEVFGSVVVVTDRTVLDEQIRDTIRDFAQVRSVVGHAGSAAELRKMIEDGKKIIITTVQKFPFVLEAIGSDHKGRTFAILIDEAHSSQSGLTSKKMNQALNGAGNVEVESQEDAEDAINLLIESRKMLKNASYFAFTATPKNKTLEVFGEAFQDGDVIKRRPFHSYTMKQAIEEGFILDVLKHYTPVSSYYRLAATAEEDREFDVAKANKKLRRYVEGHEHAIRLKAEIMVDHFHENVAAKIGGEARAMVVTGSIERAIEYFLAFRSYLAERKSPYQAIVAFSGEPEFRGGKVSEGSLNQFPAGLIPDKIQEVNYRFLICADKFQTGYDEPLLHTMYVDKALSGIKAVQTLSRLNRAHPKKRDTFVLDFMNDTETIRAAFADFYKGTILSAETDPNRLHDLQADLQGAQVFSWAEVDAFVVAFLEKGDQRARVDPILDQCVAVYGELDEDAQVAFKGNAKAFVRAYGFLAGILPFSNSRWEKLSIFLNCMVPKLPAPIEDDLSRGILESIDMESYRAEKQREMEIRLADEQAEIEPMPVAGGGRKPEPELERLSEIVRAFNERWGNLAWTDGDRVRRVVTEEIPAMVAADVTYRNAMANSDKQNARIEMDRALGRVIGDMMADHLDLYGRFQDNEEFRRFVADMVFQATYRPGAVGVGV